VRQRLQGTLIAVVLLLQGGSVVSSEAPHPFAPWVRVDVVTGGPGMWGVSVRYGGYYSGYAFGIGGEFTGQLNADQRDALAVLVAKLPRQEPRYKFGVGAQEGPDLTLDLLHPTPRTRFFVAVVSEAEQKHETLRAVVEVVEFLKALVPASAAPVTPW
jgi:hypothetical protein